MSPIALDVFDGIQNARLVVNHNVVSDREVGFRIRQFQFFMNVDQHVVPEYRPQTRFCDLAGPEYAYLGGGVCSP